MTTYCGESTTVGHGSAMVCGQPEWGDGSKIHQCSRCEGKDLKARLAWQPIETAPKDGTEILVYLNVATQDVVHIAWYRSEEEWNEIGQYSWSNSTLDEWLGWWSYVRGSVSQEKLDDYRTPTHWMPYEPPSAGDKGT